MIYSDINEILRYRTGLAVLSCIVREDIVRDLEIEKSAIQKSIFKTSLVSRSRDVVVVVAAVYINDKSGLACSTRLDAPRFAIQLQSQDSQ
jgi:hypothetical protein